MPECENCYPAVVSMLAPKMETIEDLRQQLAECQQQLTAAKFIIEETPAPVAPAGWKLVPVEPTDEMVETAWTKVVKSRDLDRIRRTYEVMLTVAPEYKP